MEERDPPRLSRDEGAPDRRFARLVTSTKVRRLAATRLWLALAAVSLLFVVVAILFSSGSRSVRQWLHGLPQYQLSFGEIRLDPAPPPWYLGGAPVFLARVREGAAWGEGSFSLLDVPTAEVERVFGLYAWVERVVRVEKSYPNRLSVRLEYRKPVAAPRDLPGYLLDAQGVLLLAKDVDPALSRTLIPLFGLDPPVHPEQGTTWKSGDAARGHVHTDELALRAAKLAGFLLAARGEADGMPVRNISVSKTRQLFVLCGNTWVYWREAPGDEEIGQPGDEEKWERLRAWFKSHEPDGAVNPSKYLRFTKAEIVECRAGGR